MSGLTEALDIGKKLLNLFPVEVVLDLVKRLFPSLLPTEAERLDKKLRELEKEKNETKEKFLKALDSGDVPTVNALLAELIDLM